MTLSHKTLRLLTVLSNRDKIRAEQATAEAAQRLAALDRQSATLSGYVNGLSERLAEPGTRSGIELRAYAQFIEMGLRARAQNEQAIRAGQAAQTAALDTLASATEKHKSLLRVVERGEAAAEILAERTSERRE
ncbi:hypothetical protein [uncultured Thioclava sp.]|uniref:hypothetical protein n=1 Tax=uncultured Thioclava sp. TaxID=473858 RepID=UPI0025D76A9C|nr:hypothetical protein [uncultured Thioclava sp.]